MDLSERIAAIPRWYSEGATNVHTVHFTDGHWVTMRRQIPRSLVRAVNAGFGPTNAARTRPDGSIRPATTEELDAIDQVQMWELMCYLIAWNYTDDDGRVYPIAIDALDELPAAHVNALIIKLIEQRGEVVQEDAKRDDNDGARPEDSGDSGKLLSQRGSNGSVPAAAEPAAVA